MLALDGLVPEVQGTDMVMERMLGRQPQNDVDGDGLRGLGMQILRFVLGFSPQAVVLAIIVA
jgi:hypothetical protein